MRLNKSTLIKALTCSIVSILFSTTLVSAQQNQDSSKLALDTVKVSRYGVGFVPSKADRIHGLALGYLTLDSHKEDSLVINGVQIGVSPIQSVYSVFTLSYIMFKLSRKETYAFKDSLEFEGEFFDEVNSQINGISISIAEEGTYYQTNGIQFSGVFQAMNNTNGIALSGLGQILNKANGVSLSGVYQSSEYFNGLAISGVVNRAVEARGIQIGLRNKAAYLKGIQIGVFNKTKELRGIQIGLWNNNGKFGLPFINMRFGKTKK